VLTTLMFQQITRKSCINVSSENWSKITFANLYS